MEYQIANKHLCMSVLLRTFEDVGIAGHVVSHL